MNCQLFEDVVTDLVRECVLQESVRTQALAHAESCSRCAARLADERALSAAFRLAEDCPAPAHIETALLSTYRMRSTAPAQALRPAIRLLPARYWAIAAALVVMLLGVTTFKLMRSSQPRGIRTSVSTPGISQRVVRETAHERSVAAGAAVVSAAETEAAVKKAVPRPSVPQKPAAPVEIATDFIPLTSDAELSAMESGQLIRVLLPRNALTSYGLPINQDRADKPISAQVLIGQDGVARAIRFLSDSNAGFVQTGMRSKR